MTPSSLIQIRTATEEDAAQICEVFKASYGESYIYQGYYEKRFIKKMIFSDDTAVFVAEDTSTGRILGTASVIVEIGAYSDLVSEFGRLTVRPDARGHGLGSRLMQARLDYVAGRNQVCLSETRVTHAFSTRIGLKHGFAPLGFLPSKLELAWRECAALMVKHLGNSLTLRRNHPRIIPEVHPLASLCLKNCGLEVDLVVDDETPSYPSAEGFRIDEMNQEGYAQLLRFERGRIKNREIFGPARLNYGFYNLTSHHSTYLVARRKGEIVGAVGFTHDKNEKQIRIFELIPLDDEVIRCLLEELLRRGDDLGVLYYEVDVSAFAPRMQRTLIELGFVPGAYVPALTFHNVERLDIVKMIRVPVPLQLGPIDLEPRVREVADLVLSSLRHRHVVPRIADAMERIRLFDGLTDEQSRRLASRCSLMTFVQGEHIFAEGSASEAIYLVLEGRIELYMHGERLPHVSIQEGEVLGEISMLGQQAHSATALAETRCVVALLPHTELVPLIRKHPNLGLTLYRNLAREIAAKLARSDVALLAGVTVQYYREDHSESGGRLNSAEDHLNSAEELNGDAKDAWTGAPRQDRVRPDDAVSIADSTEIARK